MTAVFFLTVHLSVHNTIYLEVHCPAVRPHVVVVSDCGRSIVDFANVSLGKSNNLKLFPNDFLSKNLSKTILKTLLDK